MTQLTAQYDSRRITVAAAGTEVFCYEAANGELKAPAGWDRGYHGINCDEVDYQLEEAGYLLAALEEDEEGYEIDGYDPSTRAFTREVVRA
jgi:hypothetical protein